MSRQKKNQKKQYAKKDYEVNNGVRETIASVGLIENVKSAETVVFGLVAQTEDTENTKRIEHKIDHLRARIKEAAGDGFVPPEADKRKNDGFIYDIVSNTVFYENDKESCAEFISYDNGGQLYDIHSHSLVDFALNDVANVRHCCLNNDYSHAVAVVKKTLSNVEHGNSCFYYLPDSTDVFSNNIKSGFSGYTYVWRSVAAAYRWYYGDIARYGKDTETNIDVVDLFDDEPAKISIKTRIGERNNEVMFTRNEKRKCDVDMRQLSYVNVARAFWKEYFERESVESRCVDRLISSNTTYNLLCHGSPFEFVYDDRLYVVSETSAKEFLRRYISKNAVAINRLAGCVVYGDFLKLAGFTLPDKMELLSDDGHGKSLKRYKERKKNGIPLWIETLPKLVLNRTVNKKRFGEYVLVKENKTVENVFKPYVIKCEEKLTLPAGHKKVLFPLTIGAQTDKKYMAKIEMNDALKTTVEFDVELKYDFDNENSYRFMLSNKDSAEKQLSIAIEKGEPERRDSQFVLECSGDDKDCENALRCIDQAIDIWNPKREYEKRFPKVKDWEKEARMACRQFFFAWVGLPYIQKEQKEFGTETKRKLSDILNKLDNLPKAESDKMEECYKKYVSATLTLMSSDISIDLLEYYDKYFSEHKSGDLYHLAKHYVIMVLCNPNVSGTSECIKAIINRYKKNRDEIFETLPLPLLANDRLLDYFCEREDEYKLLSRSGKYLSETFKKLCDVLKRENMDWPKTLRQIRNAYELTLGLLKLRTTPYWSNVKSIENVLPVAKELEEQLFCKLFENVPSASNYLELVNGQKGITQDLDCELLISRVKFRREDSLSLMHPLALTAITYLEGNPNIHMVGCGLRGDD